MFYCFVTETKHFKSNTFSHRLQTSNVTLSLSKNVTMWSVPSIHSFHVSTLWETYFPLQISNRVIMGSIYIKHESLENQVPKNTIFMISDLINRM